MEEKTKDGFSNDGNNLRHIRVYLQGVTSLNCSFIRIKSQKRDVSFNPVYTVRKSLANKIFLLLSPLPHRS